MLILVLWYYTIFQNYSSQLSFISIKKVQVDSRKEIIKLVTPHWFYQIYYHKKVELILLRRFSSCYNTDPLSTEIIIQLLSGNQINKMITDIINFHQ